VIPIPGNRGELLDYVTPTLVDVWNTAPYNHDGSFATVLHGITPCNTFLDSCDGLDVGKNLNDQHGTTSTLTPRQLRQLAAFLLAPHAASPGTVRQAIPFTKLKSVVVRFGPNPALADDRLDVKARFQVPQSAAFNLAGLAGQALTISLADVDDAMFERTVPAGAGGMKINASATTLSFSDPKGLTVPGITRVQIRLRNAAQREYELVVKGKALDLALLDKNHIALGLETADAAFVKTRTFSQSSAKRRTIKIAEQ